MAGMLLFMLGFAVWPWLRPYDWHPDPAAGVVITGAELRRDHQNYWLDLHVEAREGEALDLSRPPRLLVADARELAPADTRLAGAPDSGIREAWFKFWLEKNDVDGPLRLAFHDGILNVKSTHTAPRMESGRARHFTTHRW